MNDEEALAILDTLLEVERLKDVQELVFRQSWLGKTYQEIAEASGYSPEHIRDVGFRLWQTLSHVFGEKVTKSNIHTIVRQRVGKLGTPLEDDRKEPETLNHPLQNPISENGNELVGDRGVVSLAAQLIQPVQPVQSSRSAGVDFPGNPLPVHSAFYIERFPMEQRCYQEILQDGALIRIKAPQKMGKTSLLNRILHHATLQGYARVRLNLQQADQEALSEMNCFLRWFCKSISWKLNLNPKLEDYWDQDAGLAKSSCTRYFGDYLLEQIKTPLVLALDEVDRIFAHPQLAQDFLPLLRVWHEEANESEVWQRLRLVVVHSTEVHIRLNAHQSPFNVGLPIHLQNWRAEQVEDLAQRYELQWNEKKTEQLMQLTSGHPYLVQLAFYYLWEGAGSYDQFLRDAPTESGVYGAYLRRLLENLQTVPLLSAALKQVVSSDRPISLESAVAYQLQSMGLVKFEGNEVLPSCQLYHQYFSFRL